MVVGGRGCWALTKKDQNQGFGNEFLLTMKHKTKINKPAVLILTRAELEVVEYMLNILYEGGTDQFTPQHR